MIPTFRPTFIVSFTVVSVTVISAGRLRFYF